jgi:hypothetical protein
MRGGGCPPQREAVPGIALSTSAGWLEQARPLPSLVEYNRPATVGRPTLWTGKDQTMPRFVIERDIPGAGKLTAEELQGISQKSCGVLRKLGPQIQWLQSYVTDDKVYCIYIAPDEAAVREHARQGGFPANRISQVREIIDPTTAE